MPSKTPTPSTMKRKSKPININQMIADLKKQLSKTQDPIEKELISQRLFHWYQIKNKDSRD